MMRAWGRVTGWNPESVVPSFVGQGGQSAQSPQSATSRVQGPTAEAKPLDFTNIEAVLFDKDGTLLDFAHTWGRWVRAVEVGMRTAVPGLPHRTGNEPREDDFGLGMVFARGESLSVTGAESISGSDVVDEVSEEDWYHPESPLAIGSMDEVKTILAYHLWRAGVAWDDARPIVARVCQSADSDLEQHLSLLPVAGLLYFVSLLIEGGVRLGVVTSDETDRARTHVSALGLADVFGSVVGRDRVTVGKPNPEMVMLCCKELSVAPSRAIVIGDTAADMRMGRRAGVAATIRVAGRAAPMMSLADTDLCVRDYAELLARVQL